MDGIIEDEERHKDELIGMIDEERLNYIGSIVLGLNDALVELTGVITGISAAFSMGASDYLATRQEGGENPIKSSIYTGVAYIFTVTLLVLPFLLITNYFVSLGATLGIAVLIIFIFNYYISVAKAFKRFIEMASISLGGAAISFIIGILVKQFVGIEI